MDFATITETTGKCRVCGAPTMQLEGFGQQFACDSCEEKENRQHMTRRQREEQRERQRHWDSICDPVYQDTDTGHPDLDKTCLAIAQKWDTGAKGLGFVGSTGIGKTRALFLALRKAHDAGLSTYAIHHRKFAQSAIRAAGGGDCSAIMRNEAEKQMERCLKAKALLLDDIGKGRSTPTAVEALEFVVEQRTAKRLPILWSANSGGDWLIEKLGEDAGEAIIRRLVEFCTTPDLPRN